MYWAKEYQFPVDTALRIAQCESTMGTMIKNPHSSASGVYQFTRSTWSNYCHGDVMNEEHNIRCFMEIYPIHPEWWECK